MKLQLSAEELDAVIVALLTEEKTNGKREIEYRVRCMEVAQGLLMIADKQHGCIIKRDN